MVQVIEQPTSVQASGNQPKLIDEYIGLVNSRLFPCDGSSGLRVTESAYSWPYFSNLSCRPCSQRRR